MGFELASILVQSKVKLPAVPGAPGPVFRNTGPTWTRPGVNPGDDR
jgi:hypothetical protein